jgi:acetylglutamate kinase
VNADDAAAGLAAGLGARQLILMTDVDGIRGADGAKLATINAAEAEALIVDGTISGGMVPKVRAALAGIAEPGAEAIICDAAAPGALAHALDDPGFGTRITAGRPAATPTGAPAGTPA